MDSSQDGRFQKDSKEKISSLLSAILYRLEHIDMQYAGDVSDLGLDFTVEDETFGRRTVQELCTNGAELPVSNENKLLYVHLMADFHLNTRLRAPSAAFAAGLTQVQIILPLSPQQSLRAAEAASSYHPHCLNAHMHACTYVHAALESFGVSVLQGRGNGGQVGPGGRENHV